MSVVLFLLVSMWEWFALILLAFALYRFEIRHYLGQLVFAAFLLSLFSYMVFDVFNLALFATLIQPIVVFLFFWLMFEIPIFYAGLVVANGYLGYCLVTSLVFYALQQFGMAPQHSTYTSYIFQSITGMLVLLLARFIFKFNLGFSFVQQGQEVKNMSGTNLKLLLITILGYVALSSFNFLYYGTNHTLLLTIFIVGTFGLLQYWLLKKEREAAFWHRNKRYPVDLDG